MPDSLSMVQLARRLEADESFFIAGSSGEPVELTQMLLDDPGVAPGTRFVTSFVPGINGRNLASPGSVRKMRVFFQQPEFAESTRLGRIEFCPFAYSTIGQHLADAIPRIDTVIVQVGEPDRSGLCSLGAAVEFMPSVLKRTVRTLAIINSEMPDVPGAVRLPFEGFSAYARSDAPLPEYDAGGPNEVSDRIAAHLLPLIPFGATLQIGLGKVPAQLLRALTSHRDLAFHTGLLSDSIIALIDAGALRAGNALMTTVVVGSQDLYRRLPLMRGLSLAGVEFTHSAAVLERIPRFFAINSAIEVDLLGQVNAEMIRGRYVSGPGGLPDFAHAARRSDQGLSIIALASTDATGRFSKIVSAFDAKTPVTVPQHDVDAVVTEWGVALLRGCAVDERRRKLVAIAHPAHRAALTGLLDA